MLRRCLKTLAALAAVPALLGLPAGAGAETVIDTTTAWNGGTTVVLFTARNATWGQTITAPATDTVLDDFTFEMASCTAFCSNVPRPTEGTSVVLRGEVYEWDGSKAIGPGLWESAPRTVEFGPVQPPDPPQQPNAQSEFVEVTFETGGVQLEAGHKYVLFATISKDYEAQPDLGGMGLAWGVVNNGEPLETYTGGNFVAQSNNGDESLWTTMDWNNLLNPIDLAFRASFSPPAPTTKDDCKNGGWRNFGTVFKNQGDCVSFVATGGKNSPGH